MYAKEPVDRFNLKLTARLHAGKKLPGTDTSCVASQSGVVFTRRNNLTPLAKTSRDKAHRDSFHRAMSPILVVAQMFALLPVDGVTAGDVTALRFRWRSFRVVYTILCMVGCFFMICIHVSDLFMKKGSATFKRSEAIFHLTVAIMNISLFLKLATQWPTLQRKIHEVELAMNTNYGYPRNLSRNLRVLCFFILILSIFEHGISRLRAIQHAVQCTGGSLDWIRVYFTGTYVIIFTYLVNYSVFVALALEQVRLVAVFTWNFMDVTVILFSIMLAQRLRQINKALEPLKDTTVGQGNWRQIREDYNRLSCIVKTVDSHINKIAMLAFGNNLYYICLQLFNSMQKEMLFAQSLYFYESFTHLLLRSTAMCLFAASIHEASKEPKAVLFSVPTESYSQEVQRFLVQVSTDTIALTGCNFFTITKTLLLTLAGTIVTYEIVLVQMSSGDDISDAHNVTGGINPFCPNKTNV